MPFLFAMEEDGALSQHQPLPLFPLSSRKKTSFPLSSAIVEMVWWQDLQDLGEKGRTVLSTGLVSCHSFT